MSVLIKGVEMPTSCGLCPCFHPEYPMYCQADNQRPKRTEGAPYGRKPDWFPIIEVPAPHGRLIDADALLNLLNKCMFPSDMVTTTAVSMGINWIKEAPTVIEAEECE